MVLHKEKEMRNLMRVVGIGFWLGVIVLGLFLALSYLKVGKTVMDQASITVKNGNSHTAQLERQAVELGFTLDKEVKK